MDHADLIAELPQIVEKLTPAERIQLARERRAVQLAQSRERDRLDTNVYTRNPRVKFKSGIALLEATARNDIEEVRRLLGEGANPNSHNEDGLTPLHQCAIDNNEEILLLLLEQGADVNAQDTELWTPLHAAACCNHLAVVRHLIHRGANLLAVNADGNMPYDICEDDNTLDLIETEMARRGISQDDIDEERGSGERHMLADMKWLHEHGGRASLAYRDADGATPLHVAACNGYYDVAAFLLRCGVDPSARDEDGWTPLHAAACWAQPDLVELLAEMGADVSAKTEAEETALDLVEEDTTRHVLLTLQAEAQRKRRAQFPRDSRRQSKRRKPSSKFDSPESIPGHGTDSPFSARGAIRRLSLRDRSGVTLARIEAQKEAAIFRSLSLEDTSANSVLNGRDSLPIADKRSSSGGGGVSEAGEEGTKGKKKKKSRRQGHADENKEQSHDEWLQKLKTEDEELDESGGPKAPERSKGRRGSAKKRNGAATAESGTGPSSTAQGGGGDSVQRFRQPKDSVVGPSPRRSKRFACCTLL